jgi:hypothetical protein
MIIAILEIYTGDNDADPVLAYYDLDKVRPEFRDYCMKFVTGGLVNERLYRSGIDHHATMSMGNQCSLEASALVFPPCLVEFTLYRFIEG